MTITPDRAVTALRVLIAEGKIAVKDVTAALKRREQLIRDLRQRLVALEQGAISAITGRRVEHEAARKPKRKISAARRAALRLHGRYLGHIRTLPKTARSRIKAIRERSGVQAAIGAARKLTKTAASRGKAPQGGQGGQGARRNYQSSQQRRLARYQERERPRPDKHGGSGAGRQQGGSGAGRERG